MKLAIISPFAPYRGGIAKETEVIYSHLRKSYEVKIINFKRQYPSILFPGKNQYIENNFFFSNKDIIRLIDTLNPFTWRKTANYIIENKFDKIIFRYWHPFFIPAYTYIINYLKKENSSIEIFSICDNIYPHERFIFDIKIIQNFLKKIDYYYVMSNNTYDQLNSFIPENRIEKIYLPIDNTLGPLIDKKTAREKLNYKTSLSLLFFGLIREYKGLDVLLKSMKSLVKEISDIKLYIVGECYENEIKYKTIIDDYQLSDNIVWVNEYILDKDINLYFSSCDVVVLPYKQTSQSGIIPIAYKYNKLVLASNINGINDYVIPGKTGYLFEKNNYNSLSKTIVDIYKKHDFSLSEKYIEKFKKRFDSEQLVEKIISFMN